MIKEWIFRRNSLVLHLQTQIESQNEELKEYRIANAELNTELQKKKNEVEVLKIEIEQIKEKIVKEQDLGVILLRMLGAILHFPEEKKVQDELQALYSRFMGFSCNPIPWYPFQNYK